ncbi:hypothetical protein QBC43DRAFT_318902 [Cladorrhinum sp. PSN259]|nr:hypothetical protein QBC43DRAFT_318902 [Cladorrhinum sp. PSN259]
MDRRTPALIAQAPPEGLGPPPPPILMAYSCQTCAKRKVRCDKVSPKCSSCRKAGFDCTYPAPQPRRRKRQFRVDITILEKIEQYERILREHDLLPSSGRAVTPPASTPSSSVAPFKPSTEPVLAHWNNADEQMPEGKLLVGKGGQPRYTDSSLWRKLRDQFEGDLQLSSDDEQSEEEDINDHAAPPDPFPGAFLAVGNTYQNLLRYHPSHEEAVVLWNIYRENVEPISRTLHAPSTTQIVETVSRQPGEASRAHEALVFAIYHFAVFSLSEEECTEKFGAEPGQSRTALLRRYQYATQQALVNASFLKTADMTVLQALVLFLASSIYTYDSHTFWILTGVSMRIGQRIGLHRDGEKLGLPPFEVQMRRRIFCQLLPLDGLASHMSGIAGVFTVPDGWDTLPPLNINDDQIWPGMTETPVEQKGATDMIFFLSRLCCGKLLAKATKIANEKDGIQFLAEAKSEIEETYIRYCDVVNPLHFIAVTMARSSLTAMELRSKLPKVKQNQATDAERRELFQIAMRILEADIATHTQDVFLKRFWWHVRPFYIWGSWDALIVVLSTLYRSGHLGNDDGHLLSPAEVDEAWKKMEQVYRDHHGELIESKRALHTTFGRLTLRAWSVRRSLQNGIPEPAFITALRGRAVRRQGNATDMPSSTSGASGSSLLSQPTPSQVDSQLSAGMDITFTPEDFNFDANAPDFDWMFWDQMVAGGNDSGGQAESNYYHCN